MYGALVAALINFGISAWNMAKRSFYLVFNNNLSEYDLTSPVTFYEDTIYVRGLGKRVVPGIMTEAEARIEKSQSSFQGTTLYTSTATPKPTSKISTSITATRTDKDTSIHMRLLIA
jgi:hypothetical protein